MSEDEYKAELGPRVLAWLGYEESERVLCRKDGTNTSFRLPARVARFHLAAPVSQSTVKVVEVCNDASLGI